MRNLALSITVIFVLAAFAAEASNCSDNLDPAQGKFSSTDYASFKKLGLTEKDLQAMALGQNPSPQALYNVASYLNISLGEAHGLIQKIKTDLR